MINRSTATTTSSTATSFIDLFKLTTTSMNSLIILLVSSLLVLFVNEILAFQRLLPVTRTGSKILFMISPAASLLRKNKQKEIEILKKEVAESNGDHFITKFLANNTQRPFGVGKPIDFFNATSWSFNTITVIPEFNRKSKTGFIVGMPPPVILGGILRDAGAKAIVVSTDKRSGGSTILDVEQFAREQTNARIFSPGPIPIVLNDFIVDNIQIEQAAAVGAAAVTLTPELTDNLDEQIAHCKKLNIEPIVMVKTLEEGKLAVELGSRVICLHQLEEEELIELRQQLPTKPGLIYGAKLRSSSEFSTYSEIDTSWVLRDSQFSFVWPTPESVFGNGFQDIYSVCLAMRSKAARLFLSPRQFLMDRKKEGAQEYLGDILY